MMRRNATDRDAWDHFRTAWDRFGATPRTRLVAVLSAAMTEAAAAGDLEAVAVVADAIARLAGRPDHSQAAAGWRPGVVAAAGQGPGRDPEASLSFPRRIPSDSETLHDEE